MCRTQFRSLGIGCEQYFSQTFSLALAFLFMLGINLGELLANLNSFQASGDEEDFGSQVLSTILKGTTLGARTEKAEVFSSGNVNLGCTTFFALYLLLLGYFQSDRARRVQERALLPGRRL